MYFKGSMRRVLESVNVRMFADKLPAVGGFTEATHRARGGGGGARARLSVWPGSIKNVDGK